MTNERMMEMMEMMEFFEMYEAFKTMKATKNVSARTATIATTNNNNNNNNVANYFDNANLVQRGNDVVETSINKNYGDVATKFKLHEQTDINGIKYYCIKSGMCTKKKKLDVNGNQVFNQWGNPVYTRFNKTAYELAKNMIKSVDGITTIDVPFKDKDGKIMQYKKPWNAWGFKTKKAAQEALDTLPKVVNAKDIKEAENK